MTKTKLTVLLFTLLFLLPNISVSQDKDILNYFKNFSISTYVDAYYSYDNDKNVFDGPRLFGSLSPYRDQFRLNIAQVSLKYSAEKIRGTFTIHYGDIPEVNWGPVTRSKYVQEANVGFSPVKSLWIDGGYFVTHIGAESFPKYNFFSSFSLMSNFEPFLQSGVKVSYDFSDKFSACLHILNGNNLFEDNNKNKSAGVQLSYTASPKLKLIYNNIVGNEQPAGFQGKTRLLNNFIVNFYPTDKIDVVAAADYGTQELSKLSDPTKSANYYGVSLAGRYKFTPKYSASLRGEFFQDLDGVVSSIMYNGTGIKANALTIGCEYKPVDNAYVRLEYRYVQTDAAQKIFYNGANNRSEATLSMGFEY
ncbi:MAG: outer membrane beta-barrel protein [Ignavibacteria bacterium]|nr:outer membrane beta-barrel protein [Ignavibacteria bacterium]